MDSTGLVTLSLILVNFIVSYRGFKEHGFLDKYAFEVDGILLRKEYHRLVTSGFLHVGWTHLIFNMISLYAFAGTLQLFLGGLNFCIVYAASLLGGSLFSLFMHRNHGDYTAVGASGAVCGIIFASVALIPGVGVGIFFVNVYIPGWLYGILFVLYSVYGIRSQRDNIGHEAHLGGALIGMAAAIAMRPASLEYNLMPIATILVLSVILIYFIIAKPESIRIDNFFFSTHKYYTIEDRYNAQKREQQKEVDRILEKVHKRGVGSLTKKEKEILDRQAKR